MGTGIGFVFAAMVVVAMSVLFIALTVRFAGKRIVTCPETNAPVGAEIRAALAAGSWIVTQPRFVVSTCSRWPERARCDQACAPQIEAAPDNTLVRTMVGQWYAGHTCAFCAKPIREISGGACPPALLAPDGTLRRWNDVAAEDLPALLASSVAVCASCELVEDFRRHFPARVIERPAMPAMSRAVPPSSQAVY